MNTAQYRLATLCRLVCLGFVLTSPTLGQPRFTDVTEAVIPFPLFEGLGLSLGDYNNDGWPDLVVAEGSNWRAQAGDRIALLHNTGAGTFADRSGVLPAELLAFDPRAQIGETFAAAVWGDYDRDGDADLYVPLGGGDQSGRGFRRGPNALLRNDGGSFFLVSGMAGLTDELSSEAATWLDYDGDGHLDLYATDAVVLDQGGLIMNAASGRSRLYHNEGDGTFTDATAQAGLLGIAGSRNSAAFDANGDGWVDLTTYRFDRSEFGQNRRLFLNDGQGGFVDRTPADMDGLGPSAGLALGDIDHDGDIDLFHATAFNTGDDTPWRSVLLLNQGDGQFLDVTEGLGLGVVTNLALFGALFEDLDNDGDLDLVTGFPHLLFLNDGHGFFTESSRPSGLPLFSLPLMPGDYDRDGFLDLVVGTHFSHSNQLGGVFRNAGNDNHHLQVELVGRTSNPHGLGAQLRAVAGPLRQTRQVLGATSVYQAEPAVHFGLGAHTRVDTLWVRWPSGQEQVHTDIPADRRLRLFEGRADYHLAEPTRWTHAWPDTLRLGQTLDATVEVTPARFAPDAVLDRVTADLSAWGGGAAEPLTPAGDGTYRLESGPLSTVGSPGRREVGVRIEQTTPFGPRWTQLVHIIEVQPEPLPPPLRVYADDLAPGWQVEGVIRDLNLDLPQDTELRGGRVRLEPGSEPVAFQGQTALAVQVDSLVPTDPNFTRWEQWRVTLRPPEPVAHYQTLRFAFHPGSAQVVVLPLMLVFVNGRHITDVWLSTDPVWAQLRRTPLALDASRPAWHVVDVPLNVPGVRGQPIESISIEGFLQGTFYFDQIELLPEGRAASAMTAVVERRDGPVPEDFALAQNFPNPFNAGTAIHFAVPTAGEVALALYNLAGQQVARLVQGRRPAGTYTVRWDGRDEAGRELASGVYLYRLQVGDRVETRKLLLLR